MASAPELAFLLNSLVLEAPEAEKAQLTYAASPYLLNAQGPACLRLYSAATAELSPNADRGSEEEAPFSPSILTTVVSFLPPWPSKLTCAPGLCTSSCLCLEPVLPRSPHGFFPLCPEVSSFLRCHSLTARISPAFFLIALVLTSHENIKFYFLLNPIRDKRFVFFRQRCPQP